MRLFPIPAETPADYAFRQATAENAYRNYSGLVLHEKALGIPARQSPVWQGFGGPQHPRFDSPLVGTDTASILAKMDYFAWQGIKNMDQWGTVVPEPVPALFFAPPPEIHSPVPIEWNQLSTLLFTAKAGPEKGKIIGYPGQGTHSWTASPHNWQSDNAVDVKIPMRTPIRAIADGIISTKYGFGDTGAGGRFEGKRLHLEYSQNVAYYAHLDSLVVSPGQRVKAGQIIGYSGSANNTPHLHFALKRNTPLVVFRGNRQRPY